MRKIRHILSALLVASSTCSLKAVEYESCDTLQEVTVSTIKQTSDLNKSPASVTVLNGEHVERMGVDAVKNVFNNFILLYLFNFYFDLKFILNVTPQRVGVPRCRKAFPIETK